MQNPLYRDAAFQSLNDFMSSVLLSLFLPSTKLVVELDGVRRRSRSSGLG